MAWNIFDVCLWENTGKPQTTRSKKKKKYKVIYWELFLDSQECGVGKRGKKMGEDEDKNKKKIINTTGKYLIFDERSAVNVAFSCLF